MSVDEFLMLKISELENTIKESGGKFPLVKLRHDQLVRKKNSSKYNIIKIEVVRGHRGGFNFYYMTIIYSLDREPCNMLFDHDFEVISLGSGLGVYNEIDKNKRILDYLVWE